MSIPLVQEATKDAINTSIIAIKRNIERINMLLGLVDSGSPDLSGLATKQELEDAVNSLQPVDEVALDNMHSVSSNAVAKCLAYSLIEQKTGETWVDGKPIYRKVIECGQLPNNNSKSIPCNISNLEQVVSLQGYAQNGNLFIPLTYTSNYSLQYTIELYYNEGNIIIVTGMDRTSYTKSFAILEYTKITD